MALFEGSKLVPLGEETLTTRLLATGGRIPDVLGRAALGLALASVSGLAMGARDGALAMAVHGAGVPVALLAVTLLGVPSLYVVLSLFDAPLDLRELLGAASSALGSTGLMLAGLGPTMMLFGVTSAGPDGAAISASAGLALSALVGLSHMRFEIASALAEASTTRRAIATSVLAAFGVFAFVLATRLAFGLLPALTGGHS